MDILDKDKKVVDTYTICTESTKNQHIKETAAKSILLNNTSKTLSVGGTEKLKATVLPVTATDKAVSYTTSDETVAAVSADGVVTAKKAGKAVITASTANGVTAACSITVNDYSNVSPVIYLPLDGEDEVELHGKAAIAQDPDNSSNKALLVDATGGGENGNYAIAKKGITEYDFSEGATVSLNVRPNANSSDWNYLFALGQTKSSGNWAYCDGTV